MLLFPFPSVLKELLTGEVAFLDTLGSKLSHHLGFGGDCGMVGTGHPEGVFAKQTGTADKDILNGVVEHVPHVGYTCHIWRRNNDGVRLTGIRLGVKQPMLQPVGIPFVLNRFGVIFRG